MIKILKNIGPYFFLSLLFVSSALSFEVKSTIRFQHLTIENGLPQNSVLTVLQDSTGFMWFGTENGLVKYDGYSLKIFKHDPYNINSLSGNYISSLFEDSEGGLWIGTIGSGLNHFDPKTEQFSHYQYQANNPNSLSYDSVWSIIEGNQGNLWIGTTGGGLNYFDTTSKQFTHYRHKANDQNSLSNDSVWSLVKDSQGDLWIGTNSGLNHFNIKTEKFTHYYHQANEPKSLSHDSIRSVFEGNQGDLWIGTIGGGLNHLNIETKEFTQFRHQPDNLNSLSHDFVWSIKESSQGNLWIGTYNGLNHFNIKTKQFMQYHNQANNLNSLSHDFVSNIFKDNQGNVWVGTIGGGVNYFSTKSKKFNLYRRQPNEFNSLSNDIVWSVIKDSQDNIWIGTYKGLNHFNTKNNKFTHYQHQANDPNSLSHDDVFKIVEDSHRNLWIGTFNGLNHFDTKTKQFTNYRHQDNNFNSLSGNSVNNIIEDSKGNLWIGTDRGVNHFNTRTKSFTHYRQQDDEPNSLSHDTILSMTIDSNDNLWIGTYSGLNHFDTRSKQFTHYFHRPNELNSIINDTVHSVLEDSKGNLWIGTDGGLNLFHSSSETFKSYTTKNGLPNNVIKSIEEDDKGYIWLSTNYGLSRMTPNTEAFRNYDIDDGLQSNEFNAGASFKSKNGELFFGGVGGFNHFYPEQIADDKQLPQVVITDMLLLNKPVKVAPIDNKKTENKRLTESTSEKELTFSLAQVIHTTKEITLTYKDNIVAFEFAALHFSTPRKNQYAYQLVGWDNDWVYTDYKNRRATYTNLPDGDYTFRVKASNADGYWNEKGSSLKIKVLPPPWRTWWAYILYGLFFLSLVYAFVQSQRKKILYERSINQQLERKVAERTAELEEISLTDQLTGAHNRRFLDKHIGKEIAQIDRAYFGKKVAPSSIIGFIMLDMDHFKQVNDVHGHDAGDRVLVQLVKIITETCRKSDWVVRWGGEEFVVIANYVNLQEVQNLAERIRINIETHLFDIGKGEKLNKTCSIGISSYPFVEKMPKALSWEQTLNIADIALYAVKNNGRNAWVSLFEKNISNVEHLFEAEKPIEDLIKCSNLSYDTSLQQKIEWS